MIRKSGEYNVTLREQMRGGDGTVINTSLVSKEELNEKGRLFGIIKLNPGCSIGYHVHEGESEIFYIISGSAIYNDGGTEYTVNAGDTTIVTSGNGHAIKNAGDTPCEFVALIVYN